MWEENTRELRRQRRVLEKVASRMTNTSMAAAFERWRENIVEKRTMEARTARVVLRWKMHAAVRCLEAWTQLTAEEVKKRNVMQRSAGRLLNRTLCSAIGLWQQNMLTARQERADDERRHNLMSRIAKRMLNRAQSTALERWSETACELARQRAILDKILKRMINSKMSAGAYGIDWVHACECALACARVVVLSAGDCAWQRTSNGMVTWQRRGSWRLR